MGLSRTGLPSHGKSGLPDLHIKARNPGKPGFRGAGRRVGYCAVLMTASSYLPEPMPLSAKMP